MHDHYSVMSHDGKRQHRRTVIALNMHDARQTHLEHFPGESVITVLANGKRR